MLDLLDIDEATVVSEVRLARWQAEFEAQFNAPVTQMMAAQEQQARQQAAQQMPMSNDQFSMTNAGGQDGTD